MPTTITATPQPATASVLLEVTTDAPDLVFDEDGADITWAAYDEAFLTITVDGTAVVLAGDGWAQMDLTGLTIGRSYHVEVTYEVPGGGEALCSFTPPTDSVTLPTGSGTIVVSTVVVPSATSGTLTFFPYTAGALRLEHVRVIELLDGYAFTLTRSDANGLRAVRLYEDQNPLSGSLIVTDYEAALTGPITYTVTTTETATDTTALDLDETWLMVPVTPQHSVEVALVTGYGEASEAGSTVHRIIGGRATLTLRPLGSREGTLGIWCPDYPSAAAVRAVYGRGEVVLLRQPDHAGLDLYHAATGRVSITPHDDATQPRRWQVEVEYTEAGVPTDPLSGALGWDYATGLERNATYAGDLAEFPTYADRLIGPAA